MTDKPFLNVKEASELTGLTEKTIYRKISEGTIPAYKLSNKVIRFDRTELIDWIKERPVGQHQKTRG